MQYLKLIRIMLIKEGVHYNRLFKVFKRIKGWAGKLISWPILFLTITFFHYCFASMHFLFETFLFLFKRGQYEENMKNLYKSVA